MPFMSGEDALDTADGTAPFGGADLTGENLTGANLTGANLTDANLEEANLTGANLSGANFEDARLVGANLEGAKFYGVNLCNATLREAYLSGTKGIAAVYLPGMSLHENFLYAVAGESAMFKAECFWGNEADARAKVLEERGESKSAKLYLSAIDLAIMALEADGAK